jgi:dihydroorotate dehydrogenase electron transfer subunit
MKFSSMRQITATTIENVPIAERTFRIRIDVSEIAATIRPGQFVMLRLPGRTDPLLGRPFALYDTVVDANDRPVAIDIAYLVVGKMTSLLAEVRTGELIEVWGPLGNGFLDIGDVDQATLVAGGIGQTPFLGFVRQLLGERGYGGNPARRRARKVSLYYGVRSTNLAADVPTFEQAGAVVHLASDDGSAGFRGYVTQLVERDSPGGPWIGCGPEPMLQVLAKLAAAKGVTCHVSLETPMACGFGVCFSCVTKVMAADGWDYKRVCIDGPDFDAAHLAMDE